MFLYLLEIDYLCKQIYIPMLHTTYSFSNCKIMKSSIIAVLLIFTLSISAQEYKKMFEDEEMEYYVYSECEANAYGEYLLWTKNVLKETSRSKLRNQYVKEFKNQVFNKLAYHTQLFKFNFDSKQVCIATSVYYDSKGNVIKKISPIIDQWEYVQPETYSAQIYQIAKQMTSTLKNPKDEFATNQNDERVYDVVENMPQFQGGPSALFEYLSNNLQYPEDAEKEGVQGRVIVTFIVERDGRISNSTITNHLYPSLDKEAIRLIESMPKWNPGRQNGKAVRTKYTLPVAFRL